MTSYVVTNVWRRKSYQVLIAMLFSEYRHWINHAEWIVKIGYPISTRKFYFLRFCFCFLQNDNETANVRYQRMATRQNQSIFKAYGVRADRRITIQDFEWKIIDNSTKLETLYLSERWEHLRTITFSCVLLVPVLTYYIRDTICSPVCFS